MCSCNHKWYKISHLHFVPVCVELWEGLVQGHKSVEQQLGVSTLEEDTQHLECVAHCLVDVKARSYGLVPSNLGDDADGGAGEASEILDGDGLEPDPIGTAGSSHLAHLPGVGEACGVTRLIGTSDNDVIAESGSHGHVQSHIFRSRSKRDEEVRRASVKAGEEESGFALRVLSGFSNQLDEAFAQGVVSCDLLPAGSAHKGMVSHPVSLVVALPSPSHDNIPVQKY